MDSEYYPGGHEKKKLRPYEKIKGSGVHQEAITASSEDQTNGHVTFSCPVTVICDRGRDCDSSGGDFVESEKPELCPFL